MTDNSSISTPARVGLAGAGALLLALAAPLAASAHVTIDPAQAEPGGYTIITVKVPNESATATTTGVRVDLPADTPFASVSYVPVPGWTAELLTTTLPAPVTEGGNEITEAVTSVVWTADGPGIADGQLQLFPLSVGPVPDTGSIALPTTQTYSDGDVVEWNETSEDAENPAPVLFITDAPVADHHDDGADAEEAGPTAETPAAATAASGDDVLARVLGIGGLVLGAVGIVVAIASRRRNASA